MSRAAPQKSGLASISSRIYEFDGDASMHSTMMPTVGKAYREFVMTGCSCEAALLNNQPKLDGEK